MAYQKTYKTRANEARILFQLGDVTAEVHFKNGNIRDNVYATYTTRDALVQLIIEKSQLFGKQVFLDRVTKIEAPAEKTEEQPATTENGKMTMQQFREYIASNFGVNIRAITSPNALKAKARELGVDMSNVEW